MATFQVSTHSKRKD